MSDSRISVSGRWGLPFLRARFYRFFFYRLKKEISFSEPQNGTKLSSVGLGQGSALPALLSSPHPAQVELRETLLTGEELGTKFYSQTASRSGGGEYSVLYLQCLASGKFAW